MLWKNEDNNFLTIGKDVELITDRPAAVKIGKAKVTAIADQVYTGKAIKPAVTMKYSGKELTKDTDYTVSYKNNKQVGTATVTITGKGGFTGSRKITFRIIPKAVKISSLTAGKQQLTVQWKKGSNITGYQMS